MSDQIKHESLFIVKVTQRIQVVDNVDLSRNRARKNQSFLITPFSHQCMVSGYNKHSYIFRITHNILYPHKRTPEVRKKANKDQTVTATAFRLYENDGNTRSTMEKAGTIQR